jgi:hypothetical protein
LWPHLGYASTYVSGYAACVTANYPSPPRSGSGRQSSRLPLPFWLRDGAHRLLALEFAVAIGDVDLVPTQALKSIVSTADDVARQRARHFLLGHALAPHARWEHDGKPTPELTVSELEALLSGLAEDGDRAAVLALLAAKDPTRYGPPGRQSAPPESVDGVDFVPAITTPAK